MPLITILSLTLLTTPVDTALLELRFGAVEVDGAAAFGSQPDSGYSEFIHSTPDLVLEPGGRYALTFDYELTPTDADAEVYALFRVRDVIHTYDKSMTNFSEAAGTARIEATLDLVDDYQFIIGVHKGGKVRVTNIDLEQLRGGIQRVVPAEDLSVLQNPDKGWVVHFYDNTVGAYGARMSLDEDLDFPGAGMVYFRLAWSYIEPEEGVFDWSRIDPWYDYFVERGMKVGFRITCFETHDPPYATPKWVEDAGAKFHECGEGDRVYYQPEWGDPVFLSKLNAFIAAFAAKYDGDPNVAWIDYGSLGVWGEGHPGWSATGPIPTDVQKAHIDLHHKHFKKSLLVVNDDYGYEMARYARGLGAGLRDDSICVQAGSPYFHADMADWFWRDIPVIVETQHYGGSVADGAWDSEIVAQSIEDYHASWVSIHWWPDEFFAAERPLVERLANRMGYWLFVKEAVLPRAWSANQPFTVQLTWENRGVAPMYRSYAVAFALRDSEGRIVWQGADESFDFRKLGPDQTLESFHTHATAPDVPPGDYTLLLGLSPTLDPITPAVALAMQGRDERRWHELGAVKVGE